MLQNIDLEAFIKSDLFFMQSFSWSGGVKQILRVSIGVRKVRGVREIPSVPHRIGNARGPAITIRFMCIVKTIASTQIQ